MLITANRVVIIVSFCLLMWDSLACNRDFSSPFESDEDLMHAPVIADILKDENEFLILALDRAYSSNSTIVLEKKNISAFEKISYQPLSQSTLIDTSIDRELDGNLTYRVRVEKNGFKTNYSQEKSYDYVSSMLNPPTKLHIGVIELTGISLNWHDQSNKEEGYIIERDDGTGYQEVKRLGANSEEYLDAIDGVPSTPLEMSYRLKAYNSTKSSTWLEDSVFYSGIGKPTNLRITDTTAYNFTIEWDDNSNIEIGTSIEQSKDGMPFEEIGVANTDVTKYVIIITEIGDYAFRVRALKDNIYSIYSNTVSHKIKSPLPPIPTNGLVQYYPFNGNANDASGSGKNGTVRGPSLTSDRFGVTNRAYNFDGSNDYIEVGTVSAVYTHSVSVWIKPNSSNQGTIVGHIAGPSEACGFGWKIQGSIESLWYDVDPAGCGTANFIGYEGSFNGKWKHITGTFDGSVERLYVDAILVSEKTGVSFTSSRWMSIGALTFFNGYQEFFSGAIDDIRVYNRAISSEEVFAIYHENGWVQ